MKKSVAIFITVFALISGGSVSIAAVKAGASCSKKNATQVSAGKKYVCVAVGKKLNWKLAPISKTSSAPTPTPESTPAPTATPTPSASPVVEVVPTITDRTTFSNTSVCKLPNTTGNGDQYLGFPRSNRYPTSVGERKAIVIFVDFDDLKADPRAIDVWKKVQIPYAEKALSAFSYGKYNLKYEVQEKIYRLAGSYKSVTRSDFANAPGSTPALALEYSKLIKDGVNAANPDVDFSKYDFVNVVTPTFSPKAEGGASGSDGFNVDGKTSFLATVGPIDEYLDDSLKDGWLLHETGHILGLTHVYNYTQMLGAWDIMGNNFGLDELHGWQRFYLGWIEDSQIDCLGELPSKESVHKITPLSNSDGGTKMVMVKLNATSALIVETIRKSSLNNIVEKDFGVIVYKVDTTLPGGKGSISILSNTQEIQQTKGGRGGIYGTMKPDEKITVDGITIRVLASTTSADFVSITRTN